MNEKNVYTDELPSVPDMSQADDVLRDVLTKWLKDMKLAGKPITQPALGKRLGWSQPEVSNYLKGKLNADLERVLIMCKLMGTTIEAVMAGANIPVAEDETEWLAAWAALSDEDRLEMLSLAWRMARGPVRADR
jgi:transcriptional regulator with XRE-family HTH domain